VHGRLALFFVFFLWEYPTVHRTVDSTSLHGNRLRKRNVLKHTRGPHVVSSLMLRLLVVLGMQGMSLTNH